MPNGYVVFQGVQSFASFSQITESVVIEKTKVLDWLASSDGVNVRIAYNPRSRGNRGIRQYVEILNHI